MPADTPVTIPVNDPTVAKPVLLLVHVPPALVLLKAVVNPAHTLVVPVIDAGGGFTVTVVVAMHPATDV